MTANFNISQADWKAEQDDICFIREAVFMQEQNVSAELEWDGLDDKAVHLLARDDAGKAIGTVRLLPDGHIGRLAVLGPWRGKGIGKALLQYLLDIAGENKLNKVDLNAQSHARGFYEKMGFTAHGDEFLDADILHQHMEKVIVE